MSVLLYNIIQYKVSSHLCWLGNLRNWLQLLMFWFYMCVYVYINDPLDPLSHMWSRLQKKRTNMYVFGGAVISDQKNHRHHCFVLPLTHLIPYFLYLHFAFLFFYFAELVCFFYAVQYIFKLGRYVYMQSWKTENTQFMPESPVSFCVKSHFFHVIIWCTCSKILFAKMAYIYIGRILCI